MSETQETEKTIKTRIHLYRFDVSNPEQRAEYNALREKLAGRDWMHVLAAPFGKEKEFPYKDGDEITLETKFLFSNQWNATEYRVFDHYEAIYDNRFIKSGHWLEITEEMRELRANTHICGYCGAQYYKPEQVFCNRCLDSEYLKQSDLFLLRLLPVASHADRAPLSESEQAALLPQYVHNQTIGTNSRAVARKNKLRQNVIEKHKKAIENAENEYKGYLWLLDHNVNTDNCIYYDHTQRFCFGWRQPISPAVESELLDILTEFHFDYDIKTER